MSNLPHAIAAAQDTVVRKFLRAGAMNAAWRQLLTHQGHAEALDAFVRETPGDVFVLLDADAIPVSPRALPYLVERAARGAVVGNIQRSNHIDNGKHVYVAPSAMAFSRATFERLGRPSFLATARGDVGEELTFAAEAQGVPIEYLSPLAVLSERRWALGSDETPRYGNATLFGCDDEPLFYHQFEIRCIEQQLPFLAACAAVSRGEPLAAEMLAQATPPREPPACYDVADSFGATLKRALADECADALIILSRRDASDMREAQRWSRFVMSAPSLYGLARFRAHGGWARFWRWLQSTPALDRNPSARGRANAVLLQRRAMQLLLERAPKSVLTAKDAGAFLSAAERVINDDAGFSGPLECHWAAL